MFVCMWVREREREIVCERERQRERERERERERASERERESMCVCVCVCVRVCVREYRRYDNIAETVFKIFFRLCRFYFFVKNELKSLKNEVCVFCRIPFHLLLPPTSR